MKFAVLAVLLLAAVAVNGRVRRLRRNIQHEYRMCVPEELMQLCNEMAAQETKSPAKIICVSSRDRQDCGLKITHKDADFGMADPEDMYIMSKLPNQNLAVFEEIRTLEEPEAEFRYEGVAVIHKDLKIDGIKGLKGLKSCHTGVGRNVGYKIPLTKLRHMGIIGKLNEPELSPRENELKAFSTLFDKACIVGKWSPDPTIDKKLKQRYSNLCQLCEEPAKCDYPDKFSGYEGALRCLAHNGGEVAWTKVIYVKKFFGLAVGTTPAKPSNENPEEYAYLCPDGSRVPIKDTPCRWAARPWQGYIANAAVVKTVDELRTKIANLYNIGNKNHAPWLEKVLELSEKTLPRENKIINPGDYLDKANYTDVIEREYGPPFKTVRFCVRSKNELEKCRVLSTGAFSRDIRPRFDCVLEKNIDDCFKTIRDNGADIITLDGALANRAQTRYNLKPIMSEVYGTSGGSYYSVAVVRKNSLYKSFDELRGSKSCHSEYGTTSGYYAPLYTLLNLKLIKHEQCPYSHALSEFFGDSCMPGSKNPIYQVASKDAEKLCGLCGGNVDANDGTALDSKCNQDGSESYFGDSGAFRCLASGQGDVAFVKHLTPIENTDGKNPASWAAHLKSEDYELLCPDGGRAPINEYEKCKLAHVPAHMVVTSNTKTDAEIDEISSAVLSAAKLYAKRPDLVKLFGPFNGEHNLLFSDSATGLVTVAGKNEVEEKYAQLLSVVNGCEQQV